MKIVKGLVVNSISGSNRFTHDDASLIAVTGAIVFAKHPNQHEMPSDEVYFHVAGTPGDGSTAASVGGDFYVSGSANLLDDVFVPNGILHIGEFPEQLLLFVNDSTASIQSDLDLKISGTEIINDSTEGRIRFKREEQDYLFFDMIPGDNDIRIESQEKLFLKGTEIINDSTEGLVRFQKDGDDRLTFDMTTNSGELTIESDADLRLLGSNITLEGNVNIDGNENDELSVSLESTFEEVVTFEKNVFFNGGIDILDGAFYVSESEAGFGVDAIFNSNVTIEGDLTVEGQTTTLNVENLLIKDPFILLASGSTDYNTSGGIVILSGASENPEYEYENDLALGRVGDDTWGVVRIDSEGGKLEDLNEGNLVSFRAAEFQVGGDGESLGGKLTYITGSNTLLISNQDGTSSLVGRAGSIASFDNSLGLTAKQDSAIVNLNVLNTDLDEVSNWLRFDMQSNQILPGVDKEIDLGSDQFRFANVYTGDLHLRNDRGHWQIVEEADCLTIYNRLTDVRYRFVLERYD